MINFIYKDTKVVPDKTDYSSGETKILEEVPYKKLSTHPFNKYIDVAKDGVTNFSY